MRLFITTIFIVWSISSTAQKKLLFDLNVSLLESIGKDISFTHISERNPGQTYNLLSRKKFQHPYFNVLAHLSYPLTANMNIGIRSGFYFHYYEQYFNAIERTTISIPVMATLEYKLFNLKSNEGGLEIAAGKIFFEIDEFPFSLKNGNLYNISAYYNVKTRSIFKLGVEKQTDHVTISAFPEQYSGEKYQYHLNRIALSLSYGFRFGK